MGTCRPLLVLLWKNWLYHKHHYIMTFFEISLPLLLSCLLAYLATLIPSSAFSRVGDKVEHHNATFYAPYEVTALNNTVISGELLFTPNINFTQKLTKEAFSKYPGLKLQGVASETDIEVLATYNGSYNHISGVVFLDVEDGKFPTTLKYKLRLSSRNSFGTNNVYYLTPEKGPRVRSHFDEGYLPTAYATSGFLNMQALIDLGYTKLYKEHMNQHGIDYNIKIWAQSMPYPPYNEVKASFTIIDLLPSMIIYGIILMLLVMVRRIVEEKANRAKEMMKMMGMSTFTYWGSVFISNFLLLVVISIIITFLYAVEFTSGSSVLVHTSGILFFVVLLLYSAASLMFCFAISAVVNSGPLSMVLTSLLWVCSFSIPSAVLTPSITENYLVALSSSVKLSTCLLPNMALYWIAKIMSVFNSFESGSQWSNIFEPPYKGIDGFCLASAMGMLILDCFLYGILLWYLDAVWPWQPGVPKSPYFCFLPSYWVSRPQETTEFLDMKKSSPYFEDEPVNLSPTVILSHLTKDFTAGSIKKVAVNDLSLNMYSGQITALLGHNGAGKTTTMNMLTGMFPPTSGTALINGHDILTETSAARKNLGLCPQHNVLYDSLTVEEHLKFFGGLKDMPWSQMNVEVTRILDLLRLQDKRHTPSKQLSGGMKRKLSLGISLIGGSQVLILDEPTSGLDPEARRIIWDALHELRQGRTILLTTHYMEEADVLGDRIAIMANGSIQCCGSPIFLKGKFGTGYHLHVVKRNSCNVSEITRTIKYYVPDAALISDINLEMTYSLSNSSEGYSALFDTLEKSYSTLGIASCGVTITTMEDVFLKVGHMAESELNEMLPADDTRPLLESATKNDSKLSCASKLTGSALLVQQLKSLFMKRIHYSKRHWVLLIFQFIIPLFSISILIWLDSKIKNAQSGDDKALSLNLKDLYGKTNGYYNMDEINNITTSLINYYEHILKNENADVTNITDQGDPEQYFLERGEENIKSYIQNDLIGATISSYNNSLLLTSWFNGAPYHADPISVNLMTTSFLRYVTKNKDSSIEVINDPLPQSIKGAPLVPTAIYLLYAVFLTTALTFISSSFVLFQIHERVSKAKLLQRMCGVSGIIFWIVNFLWDYFIYLLCSVTLLFPFLIYAASASYIDTAFTGAIFFILMMYGLAQLPVSYIVSFIPQVPSSGFAVLTILSTICGMTLVITMGLLKMNIFVDQDAVDSSIWFLRFLPNFAASWGISKIRIISDQNTICDVIDKDILKSLCAYPSAKSPFLVCCPSDVCGSFCFKKKPYLTWDDSTAGREAFALGISGLIYFAILILLETVLPKVWYKLITYVIKSKNKVSTRKTELVNASEDTDVIDESNRVQDLFERGQTGEEALLVLNLTKNFNSLLAVNDLTFAIHKKEFFGLLGVNGAGKTTTFRMLAGDLMPTSGNAYIETYDIQQNIEKFQEITGYCPQFDALIDRLTGREMLTLFANLRGVQQQDIKFVVNRMITMCDLEEHADKTTETYSGGTKRKLSLGLALIGAPPVILLDEPTAGVDPASRRKIWETLITMKQLLGLSFILTSHGMDECEALCSRIGIMVNGQFRCMGSVQHLKSKFGQGFTLVAKVNSDDVLNVDAMQEVKAFIETSFPSAVLKDAHQGIFHYHVTNVMEKWSKMFAIMEEAKRRFKLEDYLVSDTTLEQIFLAFARAQIQSDDQ